MLHGKGRIASDAPRESFETLPPDDPHHLKPEPHKRRGERSRRATPTLFDDVLQEAS
jgi:hypothetical protein